MIRTILPATILVCANAATADTLRVPNLSGDQNSPGYRCENIPYSQNNCVRVLACVGDAGVYFDGDARGWDAGPVQGFMSDGVDCIGTWTSDGPGGVGLSSLSCDGDLSADVIYYSQDNKTGTVIGQGRDSLGRMIRVWSGQNVLQFLTVNGEAALPCAAGAIPIS